MCVFFEGVSMFYFSTFSVIIQDFKHPVLSLILLCLFVSLCLKTHFPQPWQPDFRRFPLTKHGTI